MNTSPPNIAHGLMQDWPLTTDRILDHAVRWHGDREVVSREFDDTLSRKSYAAIRRDAARLSNALFAHGISAGDRVGTLAMNGTRHLEAWYGITGIGAICHTLNPRFFADQLKYIVNHAADRLLFADGAFAPILQQILPDCPTVEQVVFLNGANDLLELPLPQCGIEQFLSGFDDDCAWGKFDERTAAGLCYTSGTTGEPKGVLYSHRSNFLHTMTSIQPDVFNIGVRDVILAVVPMYHANAWALAFSAPAVGAKLVLPGSRVDGASIFDILESERVTMTAGVPTVWLSLLDYLEETGQRPTSLERVLIGGAACPERVIRGFAALDIEPIAAWGMTEMSPIGGVGSLTPRLNDLGFEEQMPWRMKQGRSPLTIELKLVDEDGNELPHDGVSQGLLRVRGPAIASGYYGRSGDVLDAEGFFETGDIATIDPEGFMKITDRAKDLIKSGGEWISSTDIENVAILHPAVQLAAAVGVADTKWGERPHLFVQLRGGEAVSATELRDFLRPRLAKWWMPDEIIFVTAVPVGATGKIDKKVLRAMCASPGLAPGATQIVDV